MAKYVTHVVDEDVNPSEFLNGRGNCSIDGIVVANIGYFVDDLTTRIRGLQLLLQCRQLGLVNVSDRAEVKQFVTSLYLCSGDEYERSTFGCQCCCAGFTDAHRGTSLLTISLALALLHSTVTDKYHTRSTTFPCSDILAIGQD